MELNLHVLQSPGFSVHETLKGGRRGRAGPPITGIQIPVYRTNKMENTVTSKTAD